MELLTERPAQAHPPSKELSVCLASCSFRYKTCEDVRWRGAPHGVALFLQAHLPANPAVLDPILMRRVSFRFDYIPPMISSILTHGNCFKISETFACCSNYPTLAAGATACTPCSAGSYSAARGLPCLGYGHWAWRWKLCTFCFVEILQGLSFCWLRYCCHAIFKVLEICCFYNNY